LLPYFKLELKHNRGERIKDVTRHPATAPHVRSAAMTFSLANNEKYRDLATATSHLTGRTISRVPVHPRHNG
jgi:4-hydroxybutyryl-CoA dehydratase/vinylacetyl-CoA-Delta-isomerase